MTHKTLILKLNKSELDNEKMKLVSDHPGCKYSDTAVEVPLQNGDIQLYIFKKVELDILSKIPTGDCEEIRMDEVIKKIDEMLETLYSRLPEEKRNQLRQIIADAKQPAQNTPEYNDESTGDNNSQPED